MVHRGALPLHTELPVEIAYYCYLHNDIYKYGRNMKALIIIACIIVYLVMWVVTGVIAKRIGEEESLAPFVGLFWPVSLPVFVMKILIDYTDWWLEHREERND